MHRVIAAGTLGFLITATGLTRTAAAQNASASHAGEASAEPPPGAHYERRANPWLMGAGATVFGVAYVPLAIEGVVQNATVSATDTNNFHHVAAWRAVPLIGPFIALPLYEERNRTDCANYMAHPPMTMPGSAPNVPMYCTDLNAGMLDANNNPLAPNLVARGASVGDWFWASAQFAVQSFGLGLFIWGLLGETVLVEDAPTAARAQARRREQPLRWALLPGAGPAPVGLTLSAVNF
jgi:hypothetical protein